MPCIRIGNSYVCPVDCAYGVAQAALQAAEELSQTLSRPRSAVCETALSVGLFVCHYITLSSSMRVRQYTHVHSTYVSLWPSSVFDMVDRIVCHRYTKVY